MRFPSDVVIAFRTLRRAPGFTATSVVTLALGIGLATAVYTVANAVLLQPLPVANQAELVVLAGATRDGRSTDFPLGLDGAAEFANRSRALSGVAHFMYEGAPPTPVRDGDQISRFRRSLVSGNYFAVLGAQPVLGRALRPEDDRAGAAPVLVLSHRAWMARYGGDAGVVGRSLVTHADGVAHTIVGVMPPGLDFPRGADGWSALRATIPEGNLRYMSVNLVARLRPAAPASAARDEMTSYFSRADAPAFQRELMGNATPLATMMVGDTRPAIIAFAAAAALLLLITCINIGGLLLARGLARSREIAVRTALGARRGIVIGQLVTEHALLGLAGGAAGLLVAIASVRLFIRLAPASLPRVHEIHVDERAMLASLAITFIAVALFAIAPAVRASSVQIEQALRGGGRHGASRGARRTADALVAGQVALALVVLSAAAVVGRSLVKLQRADLSFDAARLLVAEVAWPSSQYDTPAKQQALLDALLPALRAVPGVQAVSPVVAAPFGENGGWDGTLAAEGQSASETATNPLLNMDVVAPEYFNTLALPLLQGRTFDASDRAGAPDVAVLSASAARHYWPDGKAIGSRLLMGPAAARRTIQVVGVVADSRYRDLRTARASIYFPLAQSRFPFTPGTLVVRTSGDPAALAPALRAAMRETAPGVELSSAAPFEQYLDAPLAQPRLNAFLLLMFAAAALLLASVGLIAVMSTMVRQRTREFGVRMAVGATAGNIGVLVLRRGLAVAAAGAVVGLGASLVSNRMLNALLFGITPTDVPTLGAVVATLLAVATAASLVPARQSTRIEPGEALRAE